ncbi:hypothetical protein KSP40_PGU021206 [Platanthera guangdongensis]|uniref:GTD-binding domain-containing protein n=1 Tax=Platanthera guangdongensis TaxID=2320717 RepID=A0ABR2N624_9ASPA
MAANRFASLLHRSTHKMVFLLIYTVLEWILITLLLINAIFSYLIIKFASFFGLHPPCILCARVDHLFEPRKGRRFYRDLLCETHAGEVSKLGFCSKHRRLSDAGDLCEDCAASVPGETDQNVALFSWMSLTEPEGKNLRCSCCGQVLESGFYSSHALLKNEPLDVLECALKDRSVREDMEEEEDAALGPEKVEPVISEILPFHSAEIEEQKGRGGGGEISLPPPHYFVEDSSFEILAPPLVRICDEERLLPIDLIDSSTMLAYYPRGVQESTEIDVEELTMNQTSVAISDYTRERDIVPATVVSLSALDWDSHSPLPNSEPCEGVSIHGHSIILQEATVVQLVTTDQIAEDFVSQQGFEEQSKVNEEMNCEISIGSDICDQEQIEHAQIHQSAPVPKLLPDEGTIDCDQVTETNSSAQRVNNLGLSPILNEVSEEGMPETPSTPYFIEGFPVLPRKFLLERRESGTESLDGSIASDFDNMEPLSLDRLKAALKAERRSLTALYRELEEERNASAIAANQTMAMITRLQEEKAAVQMEALQYQRMMEEQSEYDQEALQLLNDLMMKREREKHQLEREVDLYRERVLMYEARERRKKIKGSLSSEDSDDISLELHEGEGNISSPNEPNKNTVSADLLSYLEETDTLDGCLTEFEENRLSIFEQIRNLEEKLLKIDGEDEASDTESTKHSWIENGHGGVGRESGLLGDGLNDGSTNGSLHDHVTNGKLHYEQRKMGEVGKCLLPLFDAIGSENKSKLSKKHNSVDDSVDGSSPELVEEVDQVYRRLQALEADRDFLKHCISSLKKGEKWVNLIQEILQNLHELRRLHLHARNSDA